MDIKKAVKHLIQLSDEDFARYHIHNDPIEGKIPSFLRDDIIRESLICGYEEASYQMKELGFDKGVKGCDLIRIAQSLGIKIQHKRSENGLKCVYFGTYEESGVITLYEETISKGEAVVEEYNIEELKRINLQEVVLAHEIFHHIEATKKEIPINSFHIDLWKLGPYTHRSRLICSGEIAGMAFAKTLLNLHFCPNTLDVLLLYPHNETLAEQLYKKIIMFAHQKYILKSHYL